jgi:hypothetical protein
MTNEQKELKAMLYLAGIFAASAIGTALFIRFAL